MIKRTLYFGNPAYLSTHLDQLVVEFPAPKAGPTPSPSERAGERSIPIEDIGVLILDHQQITITQALIAKLLNNNTALITCDNTHHPTGLLLNLNGNTLQSRIFQAQIDATEPLKKQLWQQTIVAKIQNQAANLGNRRNTGDLFNTPDKSLLNYARDVKSGDSDNMEAVAASYYWKRLFATSPSPSERAGEMSFTRDRDGDPPNNLLNYGYAILRAIVARSLVGSGLLPTLGIHHRNQYNAYCLADDIMEPYRPYVDKVVCEIVETQNFASPHNTGTSPHNTGTSPHNTGTFPHNTGTSPHNTGTSPHNTSPHNTGTSPHNTDTSPPNTDDTAWGLTTNMKKQLLAIPAMDVVINDERSPLMNAVQRTTASLAKCYEGKIRKILYPVL